MRTLLFAASFFTPGPAFALAHSSTATFVPAIETPVATLHDHYRDRVTRDKRRPRAARGLTGRVTDDTGAPLPARVTILEAHRTTQTDAEGRYTFADVPTGVYSLSVSAIGYAPQVQQVAIQQDDLVIDVILQRSRVELPALQVTASPTATTSMTSPQPTSVLSNDELQSNRAASLGETISTLPGVRSLNTGSGIGKPVIRGLSSNRVLVLADGQRLETQQWGDEHGPQIEAAQADRVEVIRGPASVLYGSEALGGVVNVISAPLPDALGRRPFVGGNFSLAYATNNEQPDGTLALEGASGGFGMRGSFTGRRSSDLRTPIGTLFNSGGRTANGMVEAGYRGAWGSLNASYTRRDEHVEIHEDPAEEPDATPFQRIGEDRVHVGANLPVGSTSHLDIDAGFERNRRREFETVNASDVILGLLATTYSVDARLHHAPIGRFAGIVGASVLRSNVGKFGEETLIPSHDTDNIGLYAFEQLDAGRWIFSGGARFDHRNLDVDDDATLGVSAQRRTYNSFTGNVGVLYRAAEPLAVVLNVGRGFRAPTAFDLFANGVHEGTVRYERGNASLRNETSFNSDLAVRVQTGDLNAEVGVFANLIDNFIFPDPSGAIDAESGLPIYDITQGNARLTGFETSAEYHATTFLHLRASADYVRGQNRTLDQPLPFVPPFRATYSARLEGTSGNWLLNPYVSLGGETNAQQKHLDPEDFAPDGYTLAHVGAGFGLPVGARQLKIDLQVRNLFNTEYASFLSRYKTYALDPSRNLIVRMSSSF